MIISFPELRQDPWRDWGQCRAWLLSGVDKSSGALNPEKSQWSAALYTAVLFIRDRVQSQMVCFCTELPAFLVYESVCRSLPAQVDMLPHCLHGLKYLMATSDASGRNVGLQNLPRNPDVWRCEVAARVEHLLIPKHVRSITEGTLCLSSLKQLVWHCSEHTRWPQKNSICHQGHRNLSLLLMKRQLLKQRLDFQG